jgi:hypothetical protein
MNRYEPHYTLPMISSTSYLSAVDSGSTSAMLLGASVVESRRAWFVSPCVEGESKKSHGEFRIVLPPQLTDLRFGPMGLKSVFTDPR